MEETREALLTRLTDTYGTWYNLTPVEGEGPLAAKGEFHEHGTGYMLIRKAEMWCADTHDYLYIYSVDRLTPEVFEACLTKTRELGEPLVAPDRNHKSTYITALFVCDTAEEEALKALKKLRIRKSFKLSLHGWMEIHAAAVVLRGGTITSNGDGRRTAEFLKNVLHPRKKDLWYKLFNK